MDVVGSITSGITEVCPNTSLRGFFEPIASLVDEENCLAGHIRNLVTWGNARETLATATLLRVIQVRGLVVPTDGGLRQPTLELVNAVADLAVTGSRTLTDFRAHAADLAGLRARIGHRAIERRSEAPFAGILGDGTTAEASDAASFYRALTVHWALHGLECLRVWL